MLSLTSLPVARVADTPNTAAWIVYESMNYKKGVPAALKEISVVVEIPEFRTKFEVIQLSDIHFPDKKQ